MNTASLWLAGAALAVALPAQAQDASGGSACSQQTANDVIHIMVCTAELTDQDLATAGRAACDGKAKCGVWFWTSAEDAPTVAPLDHDGLTAEQVQSALGVYDATSDTVIRIERSEG